MYALGSLVRGVSVRRLHAGSFRFTSDSSGSHRVGHAPNKLDKLLLVWIKKYPSINDVPARVSTDEIERVRNWARIKINIAACIATVFGCIYMVKLGKDAVKRGESIKQMNLDWHKAQNEK